MDPRIAQAAESNRFLFEVWLNVQLTTMTYYRLPWLRDAPITPLEDITAKYRDRGSIR